MQSTAVWIRFAMRCTARCKEAISHAPAEQSYSLSASAPPVSSPPSALHSPLSHSLLLLHLLLLHLCVSTSTRPSSRYFNCDLSRPSLLLHLWFNFKQREQVAIAKTHHGFTVCYPIVFNLSHPPRSQSSHCLYSSTNLRMASSSACPRSNVWVSVDDMDAAKHNGRADASGTAEGVQ